MATSGRLEEPRPSPEDPAQRAAVSRNFNARSANNNHNEAQTSGSGGLHDDSNGNVLPQTNSTGITLRGSHLRTERLLGNKRPASLPPREIVNNGEVRSSRKRMSYHQDVEEALSSLLWQPYEYRTQSSDSSDTLSTLSLSTGSSSSTSLSYGYDNVYKANGGGLLHSFTDEFVHMATAPGCGNYADPNLGHPGGLGSAVQMVSNLMVLDASMVGRAVHQCERVTRSRGRDTNAALSQIDLTPRSRVRELVQRCPRISPSVRGFGGAVPSVRGDHATVSAGDMRVEIPGSAVEPQQPRSLQCSSSVSVQTGDPARPICISSDMIPSNITSVVSANVVGLPIPAAHSRSSSNLSATGRADIVPPTHPRSVSETANVLHFRSSSNLSASDHRLIPIPPNNTTTTRHPSLPPINITTSNATITQLHTHVRAGSESATTTTSDATHNQTPTRAQSAPKQPNVSNVNVNFYRAVPVNVVSNVPTIQCLNSTVEEPVGNNVSNVHIVQAMPQSLHPPQVLIHANSTTSSPKHSQTIVSNQTGQEVRTRTFTSTEAQTDDTTVGTVANNSPPAPQTSAAAINNTSREQRRRERRERRHQRRIHSSNHPHPHTQLSPQSSAVPTNLQLHHQHHHQSWLSTNPNGPPQSPNDRLPDLLNSHLPPPYTTLPSGVAPPPPILVTGPPPVSMVPFHPGVVPVVQGAPPPLPVPVPVPAPTGFRFPFPTAAGFRRCRSRLGPRYSTEEHQPKSCCGFLVSRPGSLRWFIALIALVAVCCVLVGTVLGAMRPAGRDHLTVSLLMIGVGIVLVTVSGVAWRLTSHDAPSCRAMLGLESGDSTDVCTRRFVPRLPPSYGRPHHPYAAMIYPEFQYRPPPPSYQASMQEYRLRLLLLDRGNAGNNGAQGAQHAVSPPPTYRSHAGSLLRAPLSNRRDANQSEYSCPPSYRSRSSNRPPTNDPVVHSRDQSLSLSESNHDGSVVNVVSILANQEEEIALENMTLDSLKVVPDNEIPPLRMLLKSSSGSDLENSKDGNLVTIVQKADQNPVIVTVSGSQMSTANPDVGSSNQIPSEMEILAHL